jgi:hypothetical protein
MLPYGPPHALLRVKMLLAFISQLSPVKYFHHAAPPIARIIAAVVAAIPIIVSVMVEVYPLYVVVSTFFA